MARMAPRFLTILAGRNLPKIRRPRQNRQFRTNLVVRANHAAPAIAKISGRSNVAAPPEATPTAAKTAATEATTTEATITETAAAETAAAKTTAAATAATSATTAAASGFRRCA